MKLKFLVAAVPLVASGCATTLPPDVVATDDFVLSASDAQQVHHHSPVFNYTHRNPVGPKPWREQNDAQSPRGDAS
jgi:hypothetical protein